MANKQTGKNEIGKGKAGPGRPKGSPNKTTALLKEAILTAAEMHGNDGEGKDGLICYCQHLAASEPKAFAALLGRVLPLQLSGGDEPIEHEHTVTIRYV